jgi:hypothetical protein
MGGPDNNVQVTVRQGIKASWVNCDTLMCGHGYLANRSADLSQVEEPVKFPSHFLGQIFVGRVL